MKLVVEILLWRKYPCCVHDTSRNEFVKYFCGVSNTSDRSDTSNTANSSKTSPSVTRLSSYFEKRTFFLGKSFPSFFCRIGAVVRNSNFFFVSKPETMTLTK